MIKSLGKFINYWYFRYMLVTELYMVEKWERVMIQTVFVIMLMLLSLFNWTVVLGFVKILYEPSKAGLVESVIDLGIISGCMGAYMLISKNLK